MKIHFCLAYTPGPAENAVLVLTQDTTGKRIPLQFSAKGQWTGAVETEAKTLTWHYEIEDATGQPTRKEYRRRKIQLPTHRASIFIQDYWALLAQPWLMAQSRINPHTRGAASGLETWEIPAGDAVVLEISLPLLQPGMWVEVLGDDPQLGQWLPGEGLKMAQSAEGIWQVSFSPDRTFADYKYVAHLPAENGNTSETLLWEEGPNRRLAVGENPGEELLWVNDFAFRWPAAALPRAAGVAVPVFSLRSEQSLGIGEFPDLKLLGVWAEKCGLKLMQLLPVNDTTAQYNWWDSYPYAAISVHALNPMYLSPLAFCYALSETEQRVFQQNQIELEAEPGVNFPKVQQVKWPLFRQIFDRNYALIIQNAGFGQFLKANSAWLVPYAAFCYLRELHGTADFHQWTSHSRFEAKEIGVFFQPEHPAYPEVLFHAWLQYEAHRQLTDAVAHLHRHGIGLKGDLPIGISRNSVEAWAEPEYFNLNFQAGAPPDFYSEEGQNWGFPTYRWEMMAADGYKWWQSRLHSLEKYFDAIRIDHILGFFRIWSIPLSATSAALGYFRPARPYSAEELDAAGISAETAQKLSVPQFSKTDLETLFGEEAAEVIAHFLKVDEEGKFGFQAAFSTQRKCAEYFRQNPKPYAEKLLHLHTEVLFIPDETGGGYHPRVEGVSTERFAAMDYEMQENYRQISTEYFQVRHEKMWKEAALEKLSALLPQTRMLVCAEDLGFQPTSVKEVMQELGLLGLKVLQIPEGSTPFLEPGQVDYYNVITTSTHDSESLRGWWESHPNERTVLFRELLHQKGTPLGALHPYLAEKTNRAFLQSPAMLSILPLQDWMAMDGRLHLLPATDERINNPAMIPNYWKYRMPITLQKLVSEESLTLKISNIVQESQR